MNKQRIRLVSVAVGSSSSDKSFVLIKECISRECISSQNAFNKRAATAAAAATEAKSSAYVNIDATQNNGSIQPGRIAANDFSWEDHSLWNALESLQGVERLFGTSLKSCCREIALFFMLWVEREDRRMRCHSTEEN